MAELEVHTEAEHDLDPRGQKVGVLAAMLAVALAVVTIASHRAHTDAVLLKADANGQWAFYQSKRIKLHSLELGGQLVAALGAKGPATDKAIEAFHSDAARYEEDSKEVQKEARGKEEEAAKVERRALRYDFGEGLLEIALVLTSLYFISRKMLFPVVGIVAAIAGITMAITGVLS
jgi:Domain of unknown function (DUF4337)